MESGVLGLEAILAYTCDCVERAVEVYERAGSPDVGLMREWIAAARGVAQGAAPKDEARAALKAASTRPRKEQTTPVRSCITLLRASLSLDGAEARMLAYDACDGARWASEDVGQTAIGDLPDAETRWQLGHLCTYLLEGK